MGGKIAGLHVCKMQDKQCERAVNFDQTINKNYVASKV
jgi:hypothetical protein